jgi:serine/threonine protein phosphatase PrpC
LKSQRVLTIVNLDLLDPMKANQDKYGITLNFAGEDGDAIFSVYDGHGTEGHSCATYAKNKLPQALAKYVRQKRAQKYMAKLKAEGKTTKGAWNPKQWPLLETGEFETCCNKAFKQTNQAMHDEKSVRVQEAAVETFLRSPY